MCKLSNPYVLKSNIKDLDAIFKACIPKHVWYACKFWVKHLMESEPIGDSGLQGLLEEFCMKKLFEWIDMWCWTEHWHKIHKILKLQQDVSVSSDLEHKVR